MRKKLYILKDYRPPPRVYIFRRAAAQITKERSKKNNSKSREIFVRVASASAPNFPPRLSLLDYLRDSGGPINPHRHLRSIYKFGKILVRPPGSMRSFEQHADSQRETNQAENRSRGKDRATKNLRDFWSRRPRQKSRRF